jgi:hypothetical protein
MERRVDDIQKYGSHRLAEVLDAVRGQITSKPSPFCPVAGLGALPSPVTSRFCMLCKL